jgi:hypothetical protein
MDLMQVLQGQLSDDMLDQLSQQIGSDRNQTASAANGIFATLLGGLANNASSPSGLSALAGALDRDHDGSVLDDIMGMVGGMMQGQQAAPAQNGMGILNHVLGGQQETAAQQISQSSGLNMGQIMKLMPILAPIVMGVLGKIRQSGAVDNDGLAGILTGSAQQAAQQQDGMGDLMSSILGSVLGGGQQQAQQQGGGIAADLIGSVLGNIFKR